MIWLVIVLILLVVIGPIMYLLPTDADKRLISLRAAARGNGLNVQITSVPKLDPASHERVTAGNKQQDPRISCAAYHLPVAENLPDVGTVMLLKLPPNPTVLVNEVSPGWGLSADSDEAFWRRYNAGDKGVLMLQEVAPRLPEDLLAVAIDGRSVACYWREKAAAETGVVDSISDALKTLRGDLVERFCGGIS